MRAQVGLPPRVLYSFPHPMGGPGIGNLAYHQVLALWRQGISVDVMCLSLARPLPPGVRVIPTLAAAGYRLPPRAIGVRRARDYHDRLVAAVVRRGRHNVVHAWPRASRRTLTAARAVGAAGLREVPNTHTGQAFEVVAREAERIGCPLPEDAPHAFNPDVLHTEMAEWAAATRLLVPSEVVAETFLARGFTEDRMVRYRYGYDPQAFPVPTEQEFHRPAGAPLRVVFAGYCDARKGLHLLLEAWERADLRGRAELTVCGAFEPGYRTRVASDLCRQEVRTRGFVEDVSSFLRGADILVLPSVEEGSALVTYEAQASGCALVVSRQAGAVVTHGEQGLVHEAGDVTALAGDLARLADDRQLLTRLRRGALRARDHLTWDRAGVALMDAYCEALRDVSGPQRGGRPCLTRTPASGSEPSLVSRGP
ncbi:glycosyltransferase family 4 protein [Parafrankia elaeagni]|uniref:glycosyltransferase family 4 protein n=1 Tax=Parafrankia elaeagni TaxID=222534 RepID=UPI0012B52625|nr:glycosyltransferase family 4 protein [Parafrankia elaeagni]